MLAQDQYWQLSILQKKTPIFPRPDFHINSHRWPFIDTVRWDWISDVVYGLNHSGHSGSLPGPWANEQEIQSFSYWISIKTIKLKLLVIHDKWNKRPSVFLRTERSTKVNDLNECLYAQYQLSLRKTLRIIRKSYKISSNGLTALRSRSPQQFLIFCILWLFGGLVA